MTVTSFILKRRSNHFRKDPQNTAGTSYDLKDVATDIQWITDLNFSASELTFKLIEQTDPVIPYTGDIIAFSWDNQRIFYGYVFKYEVKQDNTVSCTCYGPDRYLKNQDSIVWKSSTIATRFKNVCKRAGIKYKLVNKPIHKVKAEVCDGKTYFDMVKSAITKSYKSTGHMYFIFANYDTVELRRAPFKKLLMVIGSMSEMTSFTYSVDINQTANVVKVVRQDHKKSQSKSATATNSPKNTKLKTATKKAPSVQQWGKLQVTVNAKSKANHAKMIKQAKSELKTKNLANKVLRLTSIGNINLVAGNSVTIRINDIKKELKDCPILKATHKFGSGENYTCDLEMKAGKRWLENGSTI